MYIILVGPPAAGKSNAVGIARQLLGTLDDFPFAPTSVTMASMVDALKECERHYIVTPDPPVYYNSMMLVNDDLQVFLSTYDLSLIAGLTTFYDVSHPYREQRRTGDLRVEIKRPQLSLLGGTTPAHMFSTIPEEAWATGFTSRVILVYTDEVPKKRVLINTRKNLDPPQDLVHDLRIINSLIGKFNVEPEVITALTRWREMDEAPKPTHKRLEHYLGRRYPHLLKLCMVSAVDKGNALNITTEHFNEAMGWLFEAERTMPRIFQEGVKTPESKKMEEVHFFIQQHDKGNGVPDSVLKNFVLQRVGTLAYKSFFDALEIGGYIKRGKRDEETKEPRWIAVNRSGP